MNKYFSIVFGSALFFNFAFANAPLHSLSDSQIAAVVKAADEGEIKAGKHAEQHAKNAKVKMFAKEMVMHHSMGEEDAKILLTKLNIQPLDNEVSQGIDVSAKSEFQKMETADHSNYDRVYMNGQISMHQAVLNTLDSTLIPSAKTPQLKVMLKQTRETVAMHLKEAEKIKSSL